MDEEKDWGCVAAQKRDIQIRIIRSSPRNSIEDQSCGFVLV